MSIDDRAESSSCSVRSKYFTSNSAMDESLSEFQETKKNCAGPKTTAIKKIKPKKALKRPRGQKDIRTALRTKKNELESYAKDFDKVCKNAAIDVDSEQLQLAIALSKSLQNTATTSEELAESSQTVTTQDRVRRIRTTLQEYGFKVPEVKIVGNGRKKRKHRNNYKLIQTSLLEKKEIIANRYSQVLFQNITHCNLYYSDIDTADIQLFYLSSNVTYDILKIADTFYVDNLMEKSTSTGNLLKDWSKIPGRPESPKSYKPMSMNFSEIECSQDELDIVLSGSIKNCKDIVSKKIKDCFNSNEGNLITEDKISVEKMCQKEISKNNEEYNLIVDNENIEVLVEPNSSINKYRSCSPDMFDDEVSDIFDDSKNISMQKDLEVHKTNNNIEVMDLTEPICGKSLSNLYLNRKSNDMKLSECNQIQSRIVSAIVDPTSQLSQNTNITKRKSNDFMEFTECVTTSQPESQPIQGNIDLTQSPDIIEVNTTHLNTRDEIDTGKVKKSMNLYPTESNNIDLTKSSENNNNDNENKTIHKEVEQDKGIESMDLTQSSNTSDELPFVSLSATKPKSLDNTIIVDINDYADINKRTHLQTEVEVHIDLTQNTQRDHGASRQSQTFFEEYNHDHSGPEEPKEDDFSIIENHGKIDLTQSPKRSCNNKLQESRHNNSSQKSNQVFKDNLNSLSQPKNVKHSSQTIIEPVLEDLYPKYCPIKNGNKINLTLSPDDKNLMNDVDLTQKTDTSEELSQTPKNNHLTNSKDLDKNMFVSNEDPINENELPTVRNSQICSSFFETDDIETVSVDYYPEKSPIKNLSNFNGTLSRDDDNPIDDIDLTQKTDTSEELRHTPTNDSLTNIKVLDNNIDESNEDPNVDNDLPTVQKCNSFGKADDVEPVLVDYYPRTSPIKTLNKINHTISPDSKNSIDDIDLTQKSDTSEELNPENDCLTNLKKVDNMNVINEDSNDENDLPIVRISQRCSSLGKNDDVSIDYDEIINTDANDQLAYSKNMNPESIIYENPEDSKHNSFLSNCSQNSDVFQISDKELDYSLHKSKLEITRDNFAFGGISIMDELSHFGSSKKSIETDNNSIVNEVEIESIPAFNVKNGKCNEISPIKHRRITEISTPQKACSSNMITAFTPTNSEMIIKTNNVTPMIDYESMSTPDIHKELDKYGIKPFKRKRAIQLLTHIYNQTHPIIEADELASPPKRRKLNDDIPTSKQLISPRKLLGTPRKAEIKKNNPDDKRIENNVSQKNKEGNYKSKGKGKGKSSIENQKKVVPADNVSVRNKQNEGLVIKDAPISKEIECSSEDWVFQKREKAKVHSCRVPLHVAFYNYVSSRRELREAILCYEPVEIDRIHKDLVGYGHRYDPKDLLKFLDKKCITVKTTDNDGRNQQR